ncbi:MAG: two pore domain potassium channel family protein [Chloroflexi bacterium]|nr:two pore domain potassium channel family protein [Chloroflexota bacterium]
MPQNTDLLHVFTGISSAQVVSTLSAALNQRRNVEALVAERLTGRPLESLAGFLLSASAAFYLAERGVNPKIQTFVDARYYISTCLSVGYADIFAQTQTGKLIATLAMTIGPALTGNALDPPGRTEPASAQGQELMLERLDAILEELRQRSTTN